MTSNLQLVQAVMSFAVRMQIKGASGVFLYFIALGANEYYNGPWTPNTRVFSLKMQRKRNRAHRI